MVKLGRTDSANLVTVRIFGGTDRQIGHTDRDLGLTEMGL